MSTCPIVDNWEIVDDKLVVHRTEELAVCKKDQTFKEGYIVEVDIDSVIKLGKPAPGRLHTTRLVNIFKAVIADIERQERKGHLNPFTSDIVAYTANSSLDNIKKSDILGMFKELGY